MFPGIKAKVLIAFGTAVIVITAAAVLTFFSLQRITFNMEEVSRPDARLAETHQILSDIAEAESSVRAYSISKNEEYLEPYFRFVSTIEQRVDSLRSSGFTSKQELQEIDVLDSLIDEKFVVFSEFVDIKNSEKLKLTLGDIAQKLEASPPKGRSRFREKIRSLLGKEPAKEEISSSMNNKELKEAIAVAGERNDKALALLSERELLLLQKDENIMKGIRGVIVSIDAQERLTATEKLKEAYRTSERAAAIIVSISIVSGLMMIALVVFIFADISRSIRYRKELEESRDRAEQLAKVKEEFLANMSHEIRTPLNAIIGFSDQLQHTQLNGEQNGYLEAVRRSSEHLLKVVNDILDFSKIEAGKLKMESTGFRMKDVAGEVISTMRGAAEKKKLELGYTVEEDLQDVVLIGDPFRIRQVLLNLVNNGIKFTQRGKVWIHCSATDESSGGKLLRFDVSDSGIGIAHDKIDSIFEEFTQADSRITRKFGGTGLGLAICRKLAELQGGAIRVRSNPGQGSVFSFLLPCGLGSITDLPGNKKDKVPFNISKSAETRTVLVVDDDEMNRLLARTILNKYNLSSKEAVDGKQAVEMAEREHFDLILADIQMPEMSGIDLAKHIRALPDRKKAGLPIIALTANIVKEDISKYLQAGMDDYILKPFREEEFTQKVFRAMKIDKNGLYHGTNGMNNGNANDITKFNGGSNGNDV